MSHEPILLKIEIEAEVCPFPGPRTETIIHALAKELRFLHPVGGNVRINTVKILRFNKEERTR